MKQTFVTSTAGNAGISEKNFSSVYINRCRKKLEDFAKKKRPGSESPDRRAEATK